MKNNNRATKLEPLELHALKILGKGADKVRDELPPGTGQKIDFAVRISGAVDVQVDVAYDTPVKPQLADVLVIALGAVGPRSRAAICDALEEAFGGLKKGIDRPELAASELETSDRLIERLTRKREKEQRGGVVGSLKLERIG
jgi:hypothetical protein